MSRTLEDIYDKEIGNLIGKLIRFLGEVEVKRCLQRYDTSLRSAGIFYREYYLKTRHPWWDALTQYYAIESRGLSIKKHLTPEIKGLGGDAKKIATVQHTMPESVRMKFRKDLMDDDAAYAYLLEINIAWHFILKKYEIKWFENDDDSHSEFIVKTPDLEFEVECKRIKSDASRKIRKRDFYRLAEKLIQKIHSRRLFGSVDIVLSDRLHGSEQYIVSLVDEIDGIIKANNTQGCFSTSLGTMQLNLEPVNSIIVNLNERFNNLFEKKAPHALGAIFSRSLSGVPVDPIELTLSSLKSDDYIKGVRNKLSDAATNQLSKSRPGLIVCFLEGVDDLRGYEKNSALQLMCHELFLKKELSHVAAISYCSESVVEKMVHDERHYNQSLLFRNQNCQFSKAIEFPFINKETLI